MNKIETMTDFYSHKYEWMPDSIRKKIGHFNVFRLKPYLGKTAQPVPFKKRDYFKITLLVGKSKIEYADKVIEVQKQALVFSNPQIPYRWLHLEDIRHGYFCVFDREFMEQFGHIDQYSVFQPDGNHVFELTDQQLGQLEDVYQRMLLEIDSGYIHKYDMLGNVVSEIIHFAMKMQPSEMLYNQSINASQRVFTLFLELLERQFPIDNSHQALRLSTPSDFAQQLNVHVNHLNRAVKEISAKTTTQLISERILQEAKTLLRESPMAVAEISRALGFHEVSHFCNFFKKNTDLSPVKFRNI